MKKSYLTTVSALAALTLSAGAALSQDAETEEAAATEMSADAEATAEVSGDALLAEWEGPYGGVPAFDKMSVDQLQPALEKGMDMARAQLEALAASEEAPTFENTIAAMERGGEELSRVFTYYGIYSSNLNSPEVQAVQREMSPKLAAFQDEIYQNSALFERVKTVYENREDLNAEQQRLVWDYYTDFVRAGAALDDEQKARVGEINQRLATLYTNFSNNLLHDEEAYVTWLGEDDLEGLPESTVNAAKSAADNYEGEAEGEYAITNTRSSMDPFLTYSDDRALREEVWRTYYSRGDNGDEYDNNALIAEILKLREERSRILGYDNYAQYAIEKQVAAEPQNAIDLMMKVWPSAVARVEEEVAEMQAIADEEGADITIEPWDYRYYAEKVRKAKYDLDANEVKNYLQLSNLVDGMFWMAGELYGFEFTPTDELPVYHEDVKTWEVTDIESGDPVGLFYFDPYARQGKRSGAWMNAYRTQESMDGEVLPIVSNNSNFVKVAEGEPILISWDDASTLFHEFGHALHGLNSDVTYPTLSGTAVPRDYVEFPSQVHENWLATPEVLQNYALHYETGEPIPDALVQKIENAGTFRQGFDTTEYLASALVDMKYHTLEDASDVDPDAFERQALEEIGMPDELPMRHRSPQFAHIFSGEGYAAGYYSYLWADTYGADAWEAFEEAEGPYDPAVAEPFQKWILSVGNTIDPTVAYENFRGRPVDTNALLRQRGFPVSGVAGEASGDAGMDTPAPGNDPAE